MEINENYKEKITFWLCFILFIEQFPLQTNFYIKYYFSPLEKKILKKVILNMNKMT